MKVKIKKPPFEEFQISIFHNDKYEKVKEVNEFINMNKQLEDIVLSVKNYVDFKLIINLDINV
jgi:virulence-associated protein VapD